ncbi:MAG: helix-turn-helix domain-containing protein [Candidatus Hermodarchaeota archaeon]|nr:helix-turn-helix domain-containing protein [Candidatus Hermodarchaeota archaeon]
MALFGIRQIISGQPVEASDVMHCFLGLRTLEIDAYFYLLKGQATVKEVADALGRTRSTIQRAIQNLVQRGFAHRRTRTLRKGGYVYVYESVNLGTLKDLIKESLDSFYTQITEFLDRYWAESVKEP